MAEDDWQLEAVQEQFKVFDTITTPYEKIQSKDLLRLMIKVSKIKNIHLKMNKPIASNEEDISEEIAKYPDGNEFKLSFIVIVTNIEICGRLCKMPIFVVMTNGKKIFIDMNRTVFCSWEAFLKSNDLPSCQYCFPVDGEYCFGGKLKIDFASSPAKLAVRRQEVNLMWRSLAFVFSVGTAVSTFFFSIPPIKQFLAIFSPLKKLAEDFAPSINKYGHLIVRAVTIILQWKSGKMGMTESLHELWKLLEFTNNKFSEEIGMIQSTLWKLSNWFRQKISKCFERASGWAQRAFLGSVTRVNMEIVSVESEAEEILEASRKINLQQKTTNVATALHPQMDTKISGYVDTIFRNTKSEVSLQKGMEKYDCKNPHPVTSDLFDISRVLAEKLNKDTLQDHQEIFEAISEIVKDEYKSMIQNYSKMLAAASAGSGHVVDIEKFNQALGIYKCPKEYYWQEAINSVMEPRLWHRVKGTMGELKEQRKILILPLFEQNEGEVSGTGMYRLVGISGAGRITANDLTKSIKESQFELNEEELVTKETSSQIMILTKVVTIVAHQKLNSENTSEGMIFIVKTEY